jgi:hypothetical protein
MNSDVVPNDFNLNISSDLSSTSSSPCCSQSSHSFFDKTSVDRKKINVHHHQKQQQREEYYEYLRKHYNIMQQLQSFNPIINPDIERCSSTLPAFQLQQQRYLPSSSSSSSLFHSYFKMNTDVIPSFLTSRQLYRIDDAINDNITNNNYNIDNNDKNDNGYNLLYMLLIQILHPYIICRYTIGGIISLFSMYRLASFFLNSIKNSIKTGFL